MAPSGTVRLGTDGQASALVAGEASVRAVSSVLRESGACLGGSVSGRGFRRAVRHHLRLRAPQSVLLASAAKVKVADLQGDAWDDAALEPGVTQGVEDPFYVVDLGVVAAQLAQWQALLPRVAPYYAVKCNPDPVVVKFLAALGCNFDCASRAEVELVCAAARELPQSMKPDIIYANPCKGRGHIIDAVCRGVRLMTFDSVAEVEKCAAISKEIQLVLRIITDDTGSQCRLSSKFGAPRARWLNLLAAAKECGLQVVGVSFHVGSGCHDASRYELALKDAKDVFEMGRAFGFEMNLVDIGGGFPGEANVSRSSGMSIARAISARTWKCGQIPCINDDEDTDEAEEETNDGSKEGLMMSSQDEEVDQPQHSADFTDIAAAVGPMIDRLFPPSSGVKIIAEPGRYFVAASAALVASVVTVRSKTSDQRAPCESDEQPGDAAGQESQASHDDYTYYINDGVYGALNNIIFDHFVARPRKLRCELGRPGFDSAEDDGHDDVTLYSSTVFGPTCDSIDVISRSVLLPKLRIGDWVYFENMGAYTSAAASSFNGFPTAEKFYVCSVGLRDLEGLVRRSFAKGCGPGLASSDDEEREQGRRSVVGGA